MQITPNFMKNFSKKGFTLIELTVVVAIIGLLAAVLFANFNEARMQARDKVRMTSLKEVQLALELYKAQNGVYPAQGCGSPASSNLATYSTWRWAGPGPLPSSWGTSCDVYITGLVPDFISKLPTDPNSESVNGKGFLYITDSAKSTYKLLAYDSVETLFVTSLSDEFSRCPADSGYGWCTSVSHPSTYAVYSAGAENW
jgi:prepilin-type N-terminal cleavage/methylation domain-containing protein